MKQLKIVFMGTPGFAVGVLKHLLESSHEIVGVITAPDKPAGRGRKLRPSAVKEFAVEHGLKVMQPRNLKDNEFLKELKGLGADLQVVVAFRMLPEAVWAMPALGTFNLHASLLPQYRGAAPINWAIINGETETGVTTFFIDEKIDTGEIIISTSTSIGKDETAGSLHDKLMGLGSELVVRTVDLIASGEVKTEVQPDHENLKPAPKLNTENTRVDWSSTGSQIDALIRGLCPYPVAWTELHNGGEILKVKIYKAEFEESDSALQPGSVISDKSSIKIGVTDGFVELLEVQLPGKRRMSVKDLMNGYNLESGAKVV